MVIRFPVPNNNLILKLYPNLKLFVKNIQFSKLWLLNQTGDETFAWEFREEIVSLQFSEMFGTGK
jgi:hypothetical protein